MTNHISSLYIENKIELPWPIRQGMVYDEVQIVQRHDWPYRCNQCQNWNWTIMTDPIGYGLWWRLNRTMMWLIVQVWSTLKSELNYKDQLDRMWSITKKKTNRITMWLIVQLWSPQNMILNYQDLLDSVLSMTKMR